MSMLAALPIPQLTSTANFKTVPIVESGEALVLLTDSATLKVRPFYFAHHYTGAQSGCYVRKAVATRLYQAAASLPEPYVLLIYDGWRPLPLQLEIFQRMYASVKALHPTWADAKLSTEAAKFASKGSLDPKCPSLHFTGGAVDMTLGDQDAKPLDMGTAFDASIPASSTRHFERLVAQGKRLNVSAQQALQYRRILFHTLTRQGFCNYAQEWWHFDYGDQLWAKVNRRFARYGLIEPE